MSANNSDSNSRDLDGSMGEGQDEGGGAGGNKYRRRNVERHLAAERDRRKATKNKLQELDLLLPESSSGPRTLNQCLKVAWEHINGIIKGKQAGGSQEANPAGEKSLLASAMEASPNVGVGVLNREWKFVQANRTLVKAVNTGQSLLGVSLLSIVNPSDAHPLADLLSKLSRSTSNGGDKVFINIRFAAKQGSELDFNRYYKLDIVSLNVRPNEKVQILLVYFGPSARFSGIASQGVPRPQGNQVMGKAEELVNKVPILQGLDPMMFSEVLNMAQTAVLGPGTSVINSGHPPGPMFFLESGKCAVSVRGRQIAILDAGECFGEISLLSAEPRTADIVTLTQCTILHLPAVPFLQCAHSNPTLMSRLQNLANSRLLRDAGSWNHATGLPIGMGPALIGVPSRPMPNSGMQMPQLSIKTEVAVQYQQGNAQPSSFGMQGQAAAFDMKVPAEDMNLQPNKPALGQLGPEPLSASSSWSNTQSTPLQPFVSQPEGSNDGAGQGLVSMIEAGSNWGAGGALRRASGQVARQDSIIQLIGDIAGEASEPIAGPWASDFADGVLDGGRHHLLNRSRTATPDGAHRSMSWDSFVRGECDFSRHLAPASPNSSLKDGHGERSDNPPISTERLARCSPIISRCSSSCIADMASRLRSVVAEEGDVLVHQGSPGRSLLFIEQGTCHVIVNGLVVRTLGPGECFGEISLIMTEMTTAELLLKSLPSICYELFWLSEDYVQVIAMERCELLEVISNILNTSCPELSISQLPARDAWVLLPEYPDLYGLLKEQASRPALRMLFYP
eukprot:759790-Hanusia_phi.AAC.3